MSSLIELHERISTLEANRLVDKGILDDIQEKVNALHDDMTRYKGFLGAVTFLGSCLLVSIELLKDWVLTHWK